MSQERRPSYSFFSQVINVENLRSLDQVSNDSTLARKSLNLVTGTTYINVPTLFRKNALGEGLRSLHG